MKTRHLPPVLWACLAILPFPPVLAEWKINPGNNWSKESRVWDPAPELNLEFQWSGGTNARHEAEGEGELTWILPGGNYEVLSRYNGAMKAGKRDGKGVWLHRSGSKYVGEWKDNLKHGSGEYWLGDGGYYKGGFQQDKMHGQGLWIGTDGLIYEGAFASGKKDGNARVTLPDGTARDSVWKDDLELNAPPSPADPKPYLQLAIDRSKYAFKGEVEQQLDGATAIEYTGRRVDGAFVIEPDWHIWTGWNNGGPIGSPENAGFDYEFTGPFAAFVEIRVFNPGKTPLSIVSAEVEGEESHPDLEPLLDIGSAGSVSGSVLCGLANFKDTKVDSCEISYNVQPEKEAPVFGNYKFHETLPAFTRRAQFSMAKAVDSLGIDSKAIALIDEHANKSSASGKDYDYEKSAAEEKIIKEKVRKGLGDFAKHASTAHDTLILRIRVSGEMKVGWTDHLGQPATRTVKFSFLKTLCCLWPEYGAAGPTAGKFDVTLPVAEKNYSRPFAFRKTIRPGGSERFTLRMVSDASTRHDFRIRLTSADGAKIVSQPCKMTYLLPAGFSWKKGFVVAPSE